MAATDRTEHARRLFAGLGPTYESAAGLLSFGQDRRWRNAMISRIPHPAAGTRSLVLDVATGTGSVARELAERGHRVVGLDQSAGMLSAARGVRRGTGQPAIRYMLGEAQRLPFADASFEAITFTYLMRYVDDPATTLVELSRVLQPGGVLSSLEFHVPQNPVVRAAWLTYTRTILPIAGRLISRDWFEVGRFLGPSISRFYASHPISEQLEMWEAAGIAGTVARTMSFGGGVIISGVKRER